jgi:hypothetical protein
MDVWCVVLLSDGLHVNYVDTCNHVERNSTSLTRRVEQRSHSQLRQGQITRCKLEIAALENIANSQSPWKARVGLTGPAYHLSTQAEDKASTQQLW